MSETEKEQYCAACVILCSFASMVFMAYLVMI
jgi:hypothetical protein